MAETLAHRQELCVLVYILGLNDGHLATAALLRDGTITACASEERFTRRKNAYGFPRNAARFVLDLAGISGDELDLVVLAWKNPVLLSVYESGGISTGGSKLFLKAGAFYQNNICRNLPKLAWSYEKGRHAYQSLFGRLSNRKRAELVSTYLGVKMEKVLLADHHVCHAYAAYYGSGLDGDMLVFTLDGEGDYCCATVNRFSRHDNELLAYTPNYRSIGMLYQYVTKYLGMKPLEHEHKVMGLAPYASTEQTRKSYKAIKELFQLRPDLTFDSPVSSLVLYPYLRNKLEGHRFDGIAGAVQQLTEELVSKWVSDGVRQTGIRQVAVGGGVFLNVKVNMLLNELSEIDRIFFCPSPGDESTALGAAYYGYSVLGHKDCKPLKELYLGPEYRDEDVLVVLRKLCPPDKYSIENFHDMESVVADLLLENKIVARFNGRMEWGARALGNRSILANPYNRELIREINDAVKMRDFWMPFAPTILEPKDEKYLLNPKKTPAPYMVLAFRTTQQGRKDLGAALHPYDYTVRPQVLYSGWNESYRAIVTKFEEKTGIGAVLNTSFNLHGEPIVCSPEDAIHTMENSGLKYLAIGNYLVTKMVSNI
jgi:carbamoyltransferase